MYSTALIFGHAFNIPCKEAIEEDIFQHILLLLMHHNHIKEGRLKDKPISRNRALETEVAKN